MRTPPSRSRTEIVRYGMRVVVVGIPAPEMLKTPEALEVVGPAAFGYPEVEYVPLAGVFGSSELDDHHLLGQELWYAMGPDRVGIAPPAGQSRRDPGNRRRGGPSNSPAMACQ